jgi:carbon storage regulator CsrA
MLILSRREAEKVLFPGLGISVEVTRVQGRSVRLGIQAPDEIRIIRGELESIADLTARKRNRPKPKCSTSPEIKKCLDAANLAIHLAQNQLRQNLNDKAEDALNHALECLESLQNVSGTTEETNLSSATVNEVQSDYRLSRKKVALVVNDIDYSAEQLIGQLSSLGYQTTHCNHGESLNEFLQSREQPDLILLLSPANLSDVTTTHEADIFTLETAPNVSTAGENPEPAEANRKIEQSSLRMFGVGSLQRSSRTYLKQDIEITSWFAETSDESAAASCFS